MALKLCNNNFSVKFNTLQVSLQNLLGLGCIKWYRDEELDYYVLAILDYLNSQIILSGACTILQRLQEFTDIYETGTEMILNKEIADLAYKVGIDTGDSEYREELFTLAWGIFMSSLYMQLMYNYSGVFDDSANVSSDCHSGCHQADCGSLGSVTNSSLGGKGTWESGNINNCRCNQK
jgi:hypothetical protein